MRDRGTYLVPTLYTLEFIIDEGSEFVFGARYSESPIAFKVLPTIIFLRHGGTFDFRQYQTIYCQRLYLPKVILLTQRTH